MLGRGSGAADGDLDGAELGIVVGDGNGAAVGSADGTGAGAPDGEAVGACDERRVAAAPRRETRPADLPGAELGFPLETDFHAKRAGNGIADGNDDGAGLGSPEGELVVGATDGVNGNQSSSEPEHTHPQ